MTVPREAYDPPGADVGAVGTSRAVWRPWPGQPQRPQPQGHQRDQEAHAGKGSGGSSRPYLSNADVWTSLCRPSKGPAGVRVTQPMAEWCAGFRPSGQTGRGQRQEEREGAREGERKGGRAPGEASRGRSVGGRSLTLLCVSLFYWFR